MWNGIEYIWNTFHLFFSLLSPPEKCMYMGFCMLFLCFKGFYLVVYNIFLYLCLKLIYIFLNFKWFFCCFPFRFFSHFWCMGIKFKNSVMLFRTVFHPLLGRNERIYHPSDEKNTNFISFFGFKLKCIQKRGFLAYFVLFLCLIRVMLEFTICSKAFPTVEEWKLWASQMNTRKRIKY